jgi:hypothetical protein
MPSVKAFVLGNGRSRLQLDLHKLKPYGKIYGCNAIYRDFTPDVLVATDAPMASEIEKAEYASQYEFWTRNPTPNNYARKIDINYGFSSGPIAASLAARNEHRPIYLLGFDLIGNGGKINNVYAGTENYRKEGEKETYWGNWLNQLTTIMKNQFPKSKFIRVIDKGGFSPTEWINLQNYSEQSYEEFLHSINNKSWQKQNV